MRLLFRRRCLFGRFGVMQTSNSSPLTDSSLCSVKRPLPADTEGAMEWPKGYIACLLI